MTTTALTRWMGRASASRDKRLAGYGSVRQEGSDTAAARGKARACVITLRTKDAKQFYFGDEVEQNKDDVAKSRIPVTYLCSVDVTDIEAEVVRCLKNMWPPPHE